MKVKSEVAEQEKELDVLEERKNEALERAEQAELLYELIKDEGENTLRSRYIDAMFVMRRLD